MKIFLDCQSPKPIYLQIRDSFAAVRSADRISHLIATRVLQPGERLPAIRSLAETLQVNKLTIIEAYSVLEADGVICARQGSGYFVNQLVRKHWRKIS